MPSKSSCGTLEDSADSRASSAGGGPGVGPCAASRCALKLPLTLKDVRSGVKKRVRVAVLDHCLSCRGNGVKDGAMPVRCAVCEGTGEERRVERSVFGQFVSVAPCRKCRGEGAVIVDRCPECHGEGRKRVTREVEVKVPPGVSSENYITLREEGNVGPRNGPRGDIVVLMDVAEDQRFAREGNDLIAEVPINFSLAALGGRVTVPTVDDETRVDVPAGVQSGHIVRVRGEGLPDLDGRGRGDLLVRLVVWVPQRLTAEQERIIHKLRSAENPAPEKVDPAENRGFWSKVREALG